MTGQLFEFVVSVKVEDWPEGDDEYGRKAKDYAQMALASAGLRDAKVLDGFADLPATAMIDDVMELLSLHGQEAS